MGSIDAQTIEEAWFLSCKDCIDYGYEYKIDRGSFAGQKRKQLPVLSGIITNPSLRPISVSYKTQFLCTEDQAADYFMNYLMSPEKHPNEDYTYGERLTSQLYYVIDMLIKNPMTNQATIEIARPEDTQLECPPCLRSISWKVHEQRINMTSYWRSWDLVNGMPTNLCGLELLNEYMAEITQLTPGSLHFFSDGAHIYDYCWSMF